MRPLYRARQFWQALRSAPGPEELQQARRLLGPALFDLFLRMQSSEQAHSLRLYCQLREQGETDADLLAAALLHDVGKSCAPLGVWERVLVVLGKAVLPEQAKRWGLGTPKGLRKAFVVAEQHPAWGADLAAQAGASARSVWLIRHHQASDTNQPVCNDTTAGFDAYEYRLLCRLQRYDDRN